LFSIRTRAADRSQQLAALVTTTGSAIVIALVGFSVALVRRSSRARDEAQRQLSDMNANLETTIEERTADLNEANEEIQRFAHIVIHVLRSPLVNIIGFPSELEVLRDEIFARITRVRSEAHARPEHATLAEDEKLSDAFAEALGFIQTSIDKMGRLIT